MTLAAISNWPRLEHPALVLGLEGWVDAGYAAATAITALLESTPHEVVATFDADALLDHRSRRPSLRISHGSTARSPGPSCACCLRPRPAGAACWCWPAPSRTCAGTSGAPRWWPSACAWGLSS